jgi:signal transduction histidine kinase
MGFRDRFLQLLVVWAGGLCAALSVLVWTFAQPGLGAVRLVAAAGVAAMLWGLVRHVERTNVTVGRFVEALRFGDLTTRFDGRGGAGFDALGQALDDAMRDLQKRRDRDAEELRFLEAVVDDAPVALLLADARLGVRLGNKVARRLFGRHDGVRPDDFATYGATFARRLADPGPSVQEVLLLRLDGGPQRAVIRAATLERLGEAVRVVSVEPIQTMLDAVEVGAQADLVRVLSHEILNSLTPVTSLAGTAAALLAQDEPDIAEARLAVATLARRAEGLHRFIDSYRAVARPLEARRRRFEAEPFAAELARLFAVEWLDHRLELAVEPGLVLDADPDLLAQALINLLRNAAQAGAPPGGSGRVRLAMTGTPGGAAIEVEDDGPGVPEALRGEIFLPFFTTRATGTGVGLNLVRQIAVAHGWRIEVDSGALGGARFRIAADHPPY